MAIIKCKMCGGDLVLVEGQSVAECEYCGSRQTVPTADNEKKLNLFARANRLRAACEFDKAAGIYESIVADFPEEAEAYWGLVLCKYGIEYVDDPATGKKIPTCHRSSFDSIMDDANFEQALENADAVARKVYREEAKQIEEIRKGIIAVSSNEQPYDIFICYKETDENGDRTLDSVLAQDIYDALVGKGYRTFFARITLEDKLGMEYEPYIFAALNSAKIMLAIGTDYEYYNAVWVKNEWSRYLKLMTQDKTKHLIPCYKGIDAYDMPKEFARLQAQDLGKVGAMQDLMRGIEKILPKKNTTVIQERMVVGGGNKIASLLDRGNMALEDGDWAKADSFFEDVLNNDSKNAQAYIGKTLAQEKCRTMDAFVRKRKGLYETVKGQNLSLEPNTKHIEEVADQCQIPNYLTAEEIRNLYQFNLHYHSDVAERRQQYQKEESYWANHKLLSRAEKFAMGAVAENLQREKKALFAALSEQVKSAESTETGHKKSVQERYAQHIVQMDTKAAELHCEAVAQREQDYRNWVMKVKNTEDLETLRGAESFFANQGDYQKCPALAVHCQKRIADITAENERKAAEARAAAEAETERKRIAKAKSDAARKKKNKRITILSAVAAVIVIVLVVIVTTVVIPGNHYKQAETLLAEGKLLEAMELYYRHPGYKSCAVRIAEFDAQVNGQLAAGDWIEEEHVYEKNFESKGEVYDVTICHTIRFNQEAKTYSTTQNHNYYYSDSGRKHTSKCNEYTDDGTYQLLITDGVLYVTGISDFVGMKLEAECDIQGDTIKLLSLSGLVDMVGDDDYTSVLYCVTQEMWEAEAQAQQEAAVTESYEKAMTYLEAGQDNEAYELLTQLGDFRDAKKYLAQFVPMLSERTSTWYDGNLKYSYDSSMRLETIEENNGAVVYAFYYHDNGVLKQVEKIRQKDIRIHTYNEKGHPILFGIYNNGQKDYERVWVFDYTYDTSGNAQGISGSYFSEGEEGSYKWKISLSPGDTIEIPDLLIGSVDPTNIARENSTICILRENGNIREEYTFRFEDFDTYKDGKNINFIVSPHLVYELDSSGNTIQVEHTALSVSGRESVTEQSFQLSYDDNGRLIEKRYNDSDSSFNDTLFNGLYGCSGENVLKYTYNDQGQVISINWALNDEAFRQENFEYTFVYAPQDEMR